MGLAYTDDQLSLLEAFGDFFAKESTVERVRAAEPLGFDERLWHQLVQMGAPTMGVPETAGGGGATLLDMVLVAEQLGRHLAPVPLLETMVAARLLARAGPDAGTGLVVDAITDGSVIATVAPRPVHDGVSRLVPAGAVADVVVVVAGDDLIALRREGARPYSDPPRNLASAPISDVRLDDTWADRTTLAEGERAASLHRQALMEAKLLMASALIGIAAAAHTAGVEYVKVRKAFGVPIGWFQTIAHRLADAGTDIEGGRLLVDEAAWALDDGRSDGEALAGMAYLFAAERSFKAASESLHFHGGYGYTLEYDIQLYFRRAKAWPLALGRPAETYQQVADLLFQPGAD